MAKLRRKCEWCEKVKTVKYWWKMHPKSVRPHSGDAYFCSDKCALKYFGVVEMTKCSRCEKPLSDMNGVYIRANGISPADSVYCSAECFLADRNCIPIEEVNQDKENSHEV